MTIDGISNKRIPGGSWSDQLLGIRQTVEEIGQGLPPDSDWMPVVFVDGTFPADMPNVKPEMIGKDGMIIIGLAGGFMENDSTKDFVAMLMTGMAKAFMAKGMTFLSTVWMSEMQKRPGEDEFVESLPEKEQREYVLAQARAHGQPRHDPNRKERLMLLSVYYGGPDDGTKIAYADIKREKDKPPTLHNWQLLDEVGLFYGRFPEAIYNGLKMAAEDRAK